MPGVSSERGAKTWVSQTLHPGRAARRVKQRCTHHVTRTAPLRKQAPRSRPRIREEGPLPGGWVSPLRGRTAHVFVIREKFPHVLFSNARRPSNINRQKLSPLPPLPGAPGG